MKIHNFIFVSLDVNARGVIGENTGHQRRGFCVKANSSHLSVCFSVCRKDLYGKKFTGLCARGWPIRKIFVYTSIHLKSIKEVVFCLA